ncbi:hypothetical protein WUBG_02889 [Wuchereria bancrofti]|uniref:Uncharacterized protein n=1 Tax=Wuchereria bancrofti TaxID=6293 RepID=J9FFT6_WUCBA|nr:hypothetical protein WUBG_02889 [Wuchereria bancrofti]
MGVKYLEDLKWIVETFNFITTTYRVSDTYTQMQIFSESVPNWKGEEITDSGISQSSLRIDGWKGQRIRKKTDEVIHVSHNNASEESDNDDCFDEKTMLSSEVAALR